MTTQQKIWQYLCVLGRSIRPLMLYMLIPAALSTLGMMLRGWGGTSDEFLSMSGNFYHALGIVLVFYLLYRRSKKRNESFFDEVTLYWRDIDKRRLLLLAGTGAGISLALSAALTLVPLPLWLSASYSSSAGEVYAGRDVYLAMGSTLILAPVVEEIIFRGYMLNRLMRGFEKKTAIWICSVIFALCHVTPLWIAYALVMGLLLARISIREDNILYAIGLHMGFNFISIPSWIINSSTKASGLFYQNSFLIASYGMIGACLAVWFYRQYQGRLGYD